MSVDELRQKLMDSTESMLSFAVLLRGEQRHIVEALREYVRVMPEAELQKVLNLLANRAERERGGED